MFEGPNDGLPRLFLMQTEPGSTMTKQEAISAIRGNWPPSNYTMLREALEMAIDALNKIEEKLPTFCELKNCVVNNKEGSCLRGHTPETCDVSITIKEIERLRTSRAPRQESVNSPGEYAPAQQAAGQNGLNNIC